MSMILGGLPEKFLCRKCRSRHCRLRGEQPFERVACGVYTVEKRALKACTKYANELALVSG